MVSQLCRDEDRHGTCVQEGTSGGPVYLHRDHLDHMVTRGYNCLVGSDYLLGSELGIQPGEEVTELFLSFLGVATQKMTKRDAIIRVLL